MLEPSDELFMLAATLIDALPSKATEPVDDTLLLQLQALFGPMLLSALQIMDRRDVVRVTLPGGRSLHQVTATSGAPYTLYLDLPEHDTPISANPVPVTLPLEPDKPPEPKEAGEAGEEQTEDDTGCILSTDAGRERLRELQRRQRVMVIAKVLKEAYCPCAGYGYNTLGGDRNVLCKHLLAVIIANQMGKEIKTDVAFAGVAALLGI